MSGAPKVRDLPASKYDLTTYWGRVRVSPQKDFADTAKHCMDITDPRFDCEEPIDLY
jgi:hypothetical protein